MGGPLEGVRVVDLSAIVSGPLCTMVLADQGADVVKVEPPGTGDLLRHLGSSRGGVSGLFATTNRGKRSVALDLSDPRGKEALLALVAGADVFVQNFRPGAVERMGVGEAALRRVNPGLVYVSVSGFGETGPRAAQRAYDNVIQGYSGMAAVQTDPRTGEPAMVRNLVCDKVTALTAAQAVTAALFARERGAGGQHVRLAMLDAAVAFLWPDGMANHTLLGDGVTSQPTIGSSYAADRTADGFLTKTALSDAEWRGLTRAYGCPELAADPRFSSLPARIANGAELKAVLNAIQATMPLAEALARLEAEDVPCAPLRSLDEVHADPQVVANGLLVESDHPAAGPMRQPRPAARFDATPTPALRPAPLLGEHTDAVLAEAGLPAERIVALRAAGVAA